MRLLPTLGLIAALLPLPALAQDIVFAWNPNPSTPQVDVALAKGYFEQAGLDVQLVPFASGREGFEALVGGQVDVAFMAEFPAATGILTGQPFAIIGDLARYKGMRIIAKAPLASPADLGGKRIGSTLGTNTDYYLSEVLKSAGVAAEIVNAAPADLVPALARGDVDVAVPFPTFYGPAERMLGAEYQELRAPGYETHYILAVNTGMSEEKAAAIQKFIAVLAKADAEVKADPEAALDATAAAMNGIVPRAALATMWQDSEFGLNLSPALPELLLNEANWILSKGVIRGTAPDMAAVRSFIRTEPLAAALPDAVTLD